MVCAAEHIDCYALVGGVAELRKICAVTGGGGGVAGDHDDAGGGEGGYLLAGVPAAALAGRVQNDDIGQQAVGGQQVQINKVGVACKGRKALVGAVPVACGADG